jgi:hypothetical protein
VRRGFLIGAVLYAILVTAAVAVFSLSIPDPDSRGVFPATMAAIVLSQVGAILSLIYYRRRAVHESPPAPRASLGSGESAVQLARSDRAR